MKNYTELTVYTTHEGSELVSFVLWEYTQDGVAVYDFQDVLALAKEGRAWDYVDDKVLNGSEKVICKAYFPQSSAKQSIKEIEKKLSDLKENAPFDVGSLETVKKEVDGDLWREQWKENFKPIHIGKVVIVPEWIKYTAKDGEIPVFLDSNMAFGTGEHETTSMCVEFLEKYVSDKDVVLDVGCGSGILGITAVKLGAKKVIMTDIDECAVTATEHNMKLNGVSGAEVLLKNLLDDNKVKGNVIVCNIMAEVLIAFAPYLKNNLLNDGTVILSGILKDRLPKVKQSYLDNGYRFVEEKIKGEWSALVMRKGNE